MNTAWDYFENRWASFFLFFFFISSFHSTYTLHRHTDTQYFSYQLLKEIYQSIWIRYWNVNMNTLTTIKNWFRNRQRDRSIDSSPVMVIWTIKLVDYIRSIELMCLACVLDNRMNLLCDDSCMLYFNDKVTKQLFSLFDERNFYSIGIYKTCDETRSVLDGLSPTLNLSPRLLRLSPLIICSGNSIEYSSYLNVKNYYSNVSTYSVERDIPFKWRI